MASAASSGANPSSGKRVAVVGAGVSGLAAAYKLKSHGLSVTVFEADGSVGGKLRSVSHKGLIWDEGANTMTETEAEVQNLLDDLALREKQQHPFSQHKRYIVRNGKPVMLPTNPIGFIQSSILSTPAKIKILLEPFLWKKNDIMEGSEGYANESVGGFFERHFGREVVDYLIDPFIAGTSAGDPESLSMRLYFPDLWNIEQRFGSIIAGAFQSQFSANKEKLRSSKGLTEKRKRPQGSFSFHGGMQTLAKTLYEKLGPDNLKLQSKVLSLSYSPDGKPSSENWSLVFASGKGRSQESSFDAVIMTAPLSNVKEMRITKQRTPFSLTFIPEVIYMPLSVIITTFKKDNVKKPLEGFGVLVPSKEQKNGLRTLGTLFSSTMFPDRAPSDQYLYTTFVGGSRNMELAKASTDELKKIVTSDLRQLLGAEGEPTFVNHYYWSKGFPLYGHNYDSVLQAIKKMEEDLPGYFYAGNHKGGLSVGKSIASGCQAADLVISYLNSSADSKAM